MLVLSGKYQEDLESYLNDQIVGRDNWITIKTAIQKTTGDTDIGGAYVGEDGYDFEKITADDLDGKLINRNLKSDGLSLDHLWGLSCDAAVEWIYGAFNG